MMLITVLIPTYRRSQDLARCLAALQKQTRSADEVLVVVRDTDAETWKFLDSFNPGSLSLRKVVVTVPGVVLAMNAGLDVAQGDILAITDDDAAPHHDWLERIEAHFVTDEQVGGVGGRDWLYLGTELQDATSHPGASNVVGRLRWFGNLIGNHHIGEGESREVDVLKGVNCSYRRILLKKIRFDERLRGSGAQVHWELSLGLQCKEAGWKLIYDPAIAVDHYLGKRFDEDQRVFKFNATALVNAIHNQTLILLEHLNFRQRVIYLLWSFLVGTREAFGLIQWCRFLPRQGTIATQKWRASLDGHWLGWQSWQNKSSGQCDRL
jgi:glycosyltransferase involved in cell wall biosynthesis